MLELPLRTKYFAMNDEGKYMQVWKKYVPVIRLLLKKSGNGEQKLKLYRHEFDVTGVKSKTGFSFNLEVTNGKATNKISGSAIAKDLLQTMVENPEINEWLKTKSVKISMGKSFEVLISQPIAATVEVQPEAAATGQESIDSPPAL